MTPVIKNTAISVDLFVIVLYLIDLFPCYTILTHIHILISNFSCVLRNNVPAYNRINMLIRL